MDKNVIEKIKEKLEKGKLSIEQELKNFAKKDKSVKDDWDAKYPEFDSAGSQQMEEAADEVEEYATRLPIEHNLELRLKNINLALEKIKNGSYGKCEKCGKEISEERLKIYPEAKLCKDCQR